MLASVQPRIYRDHSEEFKAEALIKLELNEGNVSRTARELNISRHTLYSWSKGTGINSQCLKIQAGVKGPLADEFENTARMYLEHAQKPYVIEKTSGYYAVIGASDAMKSSQLLRGQPTQIMENVERNELTLILQTALSSGLGEIVDVEPTQESPSQPRG